MDSLDITSPDGNLDTKANPSESLDPTLVSPPTPPPTTDPTTLPEDMFLTAPTASITMPNPQLQTQPLYVNRYMDDDLRKHFETKRLYNTSLQILQFLDENADDPSLEAVQGVFLAKPVHEGLELPETDGGEALLCSEHVAVSDSYHGPGCTRRGGPEPA